MSVKTVSIAHGEQADPVGSQWVRHFDGFWIEHFSIGDYREVDFKRLGSRPYLAVHDIRLLDGETKLGDAKTRRLLDLRDRLSFIPADCLVSGWWRFDGRRQLVTAMTFDPEAILGEDSQALDQPSLYFHNQVLLQTMVKLTEAMRATGHLQDIYVETLARLAVLEVARFRKEAVAVGSRVPRFRPKDKRNLTDFIAANLAKPITLVELARQAEFSRYHFLRVFKSEFGLPPHQFIMAMRIERAKSELVGTRNSMKTIARKLGFSSASHFARHFRQFTGVAPSSFRDSNDAN